MSRDDSADPAGGESGADSSDTIRTRDVPVFVLCGGRGTRLKAVDSRPKSIIPVAGAPFLSYALRLLRLQGFGRIHLLAGVGAGEVARAFSSRAFEVIREPAPLGTGGALTGIGARAAPVNLILNGDSYAEALYPELVEAHRRRGDEGRRGITLLSVRVEDVADYGALEIDATGRVVRFLEKGGSGPGWINAGVYAAGDRFLSGLPAGPSSLERDILPHLASRGALRALTGRFYFIDIGTPERLRRAREDFRWIRRRSSRDDAAGGVPPAGGKEPR